MPERQEKNKAPERETSLAIAKKIGPKIPGEVLISYIISTPFNQKERDFKNNVIKSAAGMIIENMPDAPLSKGEARLLIMLLQNATPEDALESLGRMVESLAGCAGLSPIGRIYCAGLALKIIDEVCAYHDNREWFVSGLPHGLRLKLVPFIASLQDKTAERVMEGIFPAPPLSFPGRP